MSESASERLVARLRDGTPQQKATEMLFLPEVEFEVARPAIPWLIQSIRNVDLEQKPLGPGDWRIMLNAANAVGGQYAASWIKGLTQTPEACALRDEIRRMLGSSHPELKHAMLGMLSNMGPAAAEFMSRIMEIAAGPSDGYPNSDRVCAMYAIHRLDPSAAFRTEFAEARRECAARCAHWAETYGSEGGEVKLRWAESYQESADALAEPSEPTVLSSDEMVARLRHVVAPRRAMAVVDMLTRDFEHSKPAIPALIELMCGLDFELQPLDRWEESIARFGPAALANFYERATAAGAEDQPEAQAAWMELLRLAQSPHREAVHIAIHRLGEFGPAATAALSTLCSIAKGPSDGGPLTTRARALLAIHRIEPSRAIEAEFDEARVELAAACRRWSDEFRVAGNEGRAQEWAEMAGVFSS
jgi:hypothetical protein